MNAYTLCYAMLVASLSRYRAVYTRMHISSVQLHTNLICSDITAATAAHYAAAAQELGTVAEHSTAQQ
jgi:hypothetical protein